MTPCFRSSGTALRVVWATVLGLGGCERCQGATARPDAGAPPPIATSARPPDHLLAPMRFAALPTAAGFGMPHGCTLTEPIRRTALPRAPVRFVAPRTTASEIVVAVGREGGGIERRGILPLAGGPPRDLPWEELDAPPLLDRAGAGWVGAFERDGDPAEVTLWREGTGASPLASGDQLELADVACDDGQCAVLTTLVRAAAAPGATVTLGDASAAVASWTRHDVEENAEGPWRPVAIVSVDAKARRTVVALTEGTRTALWAVSADGPKRLGEVPSPNGVLDVVQATRPIVLTADRPLSDCTTDRFPLRLAALGGETASLELGATPTSTYARSIDGGAVLAWVAPVSCKMPERTLVHALLLDAHGRPASSAMAVANATGFALSARGSRVDLWLQTGDALSWITATCVPPGPDSGAR